MALQDYVSQNVYQVGQNGQGTGQYFIKDDSGVSHGITGANASHFQGLGVDPSKIQTIDQFDSGAQGARGGNFDASQLSSQANQFYNNFTTNQAANKQAVANGPMAQATPGIDGTGKPTGQPMAAAGTLPTLANGQTAGGLQNTGVGQGLQMPTGAGAGTVFDPISGKQVSPAEAAFNATKAGSQKPPQSSGAVGSTVNDAINKATPPDNSKQVATVNNTLATDPGYQKLLADAKVAQSTATQGETLSQQYQDLLNQYNIPGINSELLNDQKIINGTEDDIRHEVQAAGGFASDSQVLGLATARNKTLIQNYNNLVAQKTDLMSQINTISGLQEKDKTLALQVANQQLQIDQQLNDYAQKFTQNAQEGYKNVIAAVGYAGLYQSLAHDPASLSLAEQTLQLPPGTLATIAAIPNPDAQLKAVQLAQAKANLAMAPLDAAQKQASINASNASAASSAANTEKTKTETAFEKANGGQTPADITKQIQDFQTKAGDYITKMDTNNMTWGAAWAALHAAYPEASTQTIDNALQADKYRTTQHGG